MTKTTLDTTPADGTALLPDTAETAETADTADTAEELPGAWTCTWESGPDAGGTFRLSGQPAIVGRARGATVRCDDPGLEPHHALLVPDGVALRVLQLTGRLPLTLSCRAVDTGVVVTDDPVLVEIGHSTLRVRRGEPAERPPAHLRDTVVLRTPRQVPTWDPPPLTAPPAEPAPHEGSGGLVPALFAIGAAAVLAIVLRQPMFLAFGALGGLVAVGSWAAQRMGLRRRRRRSRRDVEHDRARFVAAESALRAAFVEHITTTASTAAAALTIATRHDHRLWERRSTHADAFVVGLGTGELRWRPPVEGPPAISGPVLHVARHGDQLPPLVTDTWLHDQPVSVDVGPGARLAVRGPIGATTAVARSIILQLAANLGPADVRVLIVSEHLDRWRWAADLPHTVGPDGATLLTAPLDAATELAALHRPGAPHLLLVTDAAELLAARTAPLRRAVADEPHPALVALVGLDEATPAVCTAELLVATATNGARPSPGRWVADLASSSLPTAVRIAGIGEEAARRAAGCLRDLIDPDDPFGASTNLPTAISLVELLTADGRGPITAAGIAARWRAAPADAHPCTPIGMAADGSIDLDLVRDGPHGLIAGTTGSGKSELLRSMVAGMAVHAPPELLTFVLVDYKGGATFDACANLPHVVGVVTDLDDQLATRVLRSLHAELRRREAVLRSCSAADLTAARDVAPAEDLPRLVVVIDEFAALVSEQPAFLHALVGIAQRGRSLGVHLVLATQRPAGVVSDDIRANTNVRCALRLHDAADALDVVGDTTPVTINRRLAGRAVLRLGPDDHVLFQTASCTTPIEGTTELATVVRAVSHAHQLAGASAPSAPWCPQLPLELDPTDPRLDDDDSDERDGDEDNGDEDNGDGNAGAAIVGLIDDPDHQRQRPLRWSPASGHLLVGGSRGSGVSSALATLGAAALATAPGTHVYVIDVHGSAALTDLAHHPGCAAVVRSHEGERLRRLLLRLSAEIDARSTVGVERPPASTPPIVLLIDGFAELRRDLTDIDTQVEHDALRHILAKGAACGVTAVLGVGQPSAVPSAVLASCATRWMLHLVDRHEASAWGYHPGDVPPAIAGRLTVAPGLQAQLLQTVRPRPHLVLAESDARHRPPPPIEVLPTHVAAADLPIGRTEPGGATLLPVGLSFDDGRPAELEVPDGEHVLVIGPSRSGRTTALRRLSCAWRAAHPHGWVGIVAPRRRPDAIEATHRDIAALLGDLPVDGQALICIDDAELVADVAGSSTTLAALAAARRPALLIVAAGAPDALRQTYGHWTAIVRRSRLGLVLAASSDLDGDLLGATLPRRRPIPTRPGLSWLVAGGGRARLIQVAADLP